MVIFHKNCRSKGCFPSPNEERLLAKELPSLMCLCGPEASLPMILNVTNPGPSPSPATSCDLLIERLRGLVSRQVEVDSFLTFPSTLAISVTSLVLPMPGPAQSSESVRGADDRLNPVIPGVVSVSTSHPEALVYKLVTRSRPQATTPTALLQESKNVHGKEKIQTHSLICQSSSFNAAPKFRSKAWDLSMCELFGRIHPSVSEQS